MAEATARGPDGKTDADLEFFGLVTASVSHELNNVNSTIEQLAGLLEDHLLRLTQGRPMDPEKLRDVHGRIVRQTRRAAGIIDQLNGFAHTADDPRTKFELNDALGDLLGLTTRLAERHRVKLEFAPAGEVWLTGDPFQLLQTVFRYLQALWEVAPRGAVIEVTTATRGEQGVVHLAGPTPTLVDEDPDRPALLADLAERMGATVTHESDGDRQIVAIAIPGGTN